MITIDALAGDDHEFIRELAHVLDAELGLVEAEYFHLVRLDSWFGDRWYAFTGVLLGELGVHDPGRLRVPPFHPHRVVEEVQYRLKPEPTVVPDVKPIHGLRSSEENDHHIFGGFGRSGSTVCAAWFSGATASTRRGSIMVYVKGGVSAAIGWYAGLERTNKWRLTKLVGTSHEHWRMLHRAEPRQ